MAKKVFRRAGVLVGLSLLLACSGEDPSPEPAPAGTGGNVGPAAGGSTGGTIAPTGGTSTGGTVSSTGGVAPSTGGVPATGGVAPSTGGQSSGGLTGMGGGGTAAGGSSGGTIATGGGGGGASGATGGKSAGGVAGTGGGSGGSGGATGGAGGATGGSVSQGGGGTSGGFMPCPATGDCKILPLGDSITDGIGFSGGYRVELFHLALQGGKHITYVGGSMNGPSMVDGMTFPKNHEGHSGWTIQQIDDIVPSPALGPDPHIILLHIGTNDMYQTPAGAPDRLGTLIDQIVADLPDALLVVAKIIPLSSGASAVNTFNATVPGLVEERANAGKHVILVDQFEGFPTSELGDGVHPNETGYARMAAVWYEAIESYLP